MHSIGGIYTQFEGKILRNRASRLRHDGISYPEPLIRVASSA